MIRIRDHKFHCLDAMRGVAAIVVVLFHFRHMLFGPDGAVLGFESGYLAVDLFFVLSGFVISYSYDARLAGGMSFQRFAMLRYIRLLPLIWIGVTLGSLYLALFGGWSTSHVVIAGLANSIILPDLKPKDGVMFFASSTEWSLFFEIIANLGFAAAFRVLGLRALSTIMAAAGIGLALCAYSYGRLQWGWTFQTFHVGLFRVAYSFTAGIILQRTRTSWDVRLPKLPSMLVLVLIAVLLLPQFEGEWRALYDYVFILLLSPLIVAVGVCADDNLGRPTAQRLALLSYPLYAVHFPLLQFSHEVVSKWGLNPVIPAAISICVAIPASLWLAEHYDVPVRKWLTATTGGNR